MKQRTKDTILEILILGFAVTGIVGGMIFVTNWIGSTDKKDFETIAREERCEAVIEKYDSWTEWKVENNYCWIKNDGFWQRLPNNEVDQLLNLRK